MSATSLLFAQSLSHFNSASDESDDDHVICIIILLIGVLEACATKVHHCNINCLYLCQQDLLPNPCEGTSWQVLWAGQDDCAFIMTMGFDVATFQNILQGQGRFAERWELSTIPQCNVTAIGEPRLGSRSLDVAGGLGLALHFLGSAMIEISLQQIFALTPSTVLCYLSFAQKILLETVGGFDEGAIRLPQTLEEFVAESKLICERHTLLEGVFGAIDGLAFVAQEADNPEVENATYNGWKSGHTINNVLVFSPRGK